METCQVCNKTGDSIAPCDREDCPVAKYYEQLERETFGDVIYQPPMNKRST